MPDFQFTPILTVVTNIDGTLAKLDWDWSDSGQGQWNPVTLEHEATAAHEAVCENIDNLGKHWLPEGASGPGSPLGAQMHEPITPELELLATIERLAKSHQDEADKQARANNPTIENVKGCSTPAMQLKYIAEAVRALVIPHVPVIGEPFDQELTDPGNDRYRCDVTFPWILDEDRLPRYECGYGATAEEAKAAAEEIGRLVAEDTTGRL
jgi:hypothetical protein